MKGKDLGQYIDNFNDEMYWYDIDASFNPIIHTPEDEKRIEIKVAKQRGKKLPDHYKEKL